MIATIHQPQYLPWLGYFEKMHQADVFIFLDDVQFSKNNWQNRNKIYTAQGEQWLTVPVLHQTGQLIKDVKINNNLDWSKKHLNSIEMNYKKAPFYLEVIEVLNKIYVEQWTGLCELNIIFIHELAKYLGITTRCVKSSDLNISAFDSTERLIELCRAVGAQKYIAGAGGENYMDMEQFKLSDVHLITQNYQHPVYSQLWAKKLEQKFISHLSIIDLLFNCGPNSLSVLLGEREG